MRIRTRVEQSSSKIIIKNSMKKVTIYFDPDILDKTMLKYMGDYFQTKSTSNIVQGSFLFASGHLSQKNKILVDCLNYEKISKIVNLLDCGSNKKQENKIRVSIPYWQILLFSDYMSKVTSLNDIIDLCVKYSYVKLEELFDGKYI